MGFVLLCAGINRLTPDLSSVCGGRLAKPIASEILELTDGEYVSQAYAILETSGGTYRGPTEALSYVGKGEFAHVESGVYEGDFKDSKREGWGTFTWGNGDTFTGDWSNDHMVSGTYTFADGREYIGTFEDGAFKDGKYTVPAGYKESDISWLEVKITDGSVFSIDMSLADGSKYNGLLNGAAEVTYPSGSTYSGTMRNGQRDGTGEYTWLENGTVQARYQGQWVDGAMSGEGTYYYTSEPYPTIQGTFSDGKPEGVATYSKEADNTFKTVWSNGSCTSVTET